MKSVQTHTHTCITALLPVLSGWSGTRKVKPIWILLKQETVSGSGISWVVCKSAPRCRQITTPATDHSVFYRPDALPAQPTASKHWRDKSVQKHGMIKLLNVKDMLKISAWKQNRKKNYEKEQKKLMKSVSYCLVCKSSSENLCSMHSCYCRIWAYPTSWQVVRHISHDQGY